MSDCRYIDTEVNIIPPFIVKTKIMFDKKQVCDHGARKSISSQRDMPSFAQFSMQKEEEEILLGIEFEGFSHSTHSDKRPQPF